MFPPPQWDFPPNIMFKKNMWQCVLNCENAMCWHVMSFKIVIFKFVFIDQNEYDTTT
jgi:hypothetical protein